MNTQKVNDEKEEGVDGNGWSPTLELRFLKKKVKLVEGGDAFDRFILQQKWIDMNNISKKEWRDVPSVKEGS